MSSIWGKLTPTSQILPGVLHNERVWGNGTTEYALDALLAATHQGFKHGLPASGPFVCGVQPDVMLPMIYSTDLMRGLIALQVAGPGSPSCAPACKAMPAPDPPPSPLASYLPVPSSQRATISLHLVAGCR